MESNFKQTIKVCIRFYHEYILNVNFKKYIKWNAIFIFNLNGNFLIFLSFLTSECIKIQNLDESYIQFNFLLICNDLLRFLPNVSQQVYRGTLLCHEILPSVPPSLLLLFFFRKWVNFCGNLWNKAIFVLLKLLEEL